MTYKGNCKSQVCQDCEATEVQQTAAGHQTSHEDISCHRWTFVGWERLFKCGIWLIKWLPSQVQRILNTPAYSLCVYVAAGSGDVSNMVTGKLSCLSSSSFDSLQFLKRRQGKKLKFSVNFEGLFWNKKHFLHWITLEGFCVLVPPKMVSFYWIWSFSNIQLLCAVHAVCWNVVSRAEIAVINLKAVLWYASHFILWLASQFWWNWGHIRWKMRYHISEVWAQRFAISYPVLRVKPGNHNWLLNIKNADAWCLNNCLIRRAAFNWTMQRTKPRKGVFLRLAKIRSSEK